MGIGNWELGIGNWELVRQLGSTEEKVDKRYIKAYQKPLLILRYGNLIKADNTFDLRNPVSSQISRCACENS
ncbi:hypothetical protein QUB63_20895 [Microcoleus sp. ARI1-B5]|uniref:hypothetical protein n=1 Tax=unclassified Microcoleus TaxID=2642155 RepID=UPI002FD270BF